MIIFGGAPDAKNTNRDDPVFNDLWEFEINSATWTRLGPDGVNGAAATKSKPSTSISGESKEADAVWPSGRGSVQLSFVDPFLYMMGGFDGAASLPEAWRFDVDHRVWSRLAVPEPLKNTHGWWAQSAFHDTARGVVRYAGGVGIDMDSSKPKATRSELVVGQPSLSGAVGAYIRQHRAHFKPHLEQLVAASQGSLRLSWISAALFTSA